MRFSLKLSFRFAQKSGFVMVLSLLMLMCISTLVLGYFEYSKKNILIGANYRSNYSNESVAELVIGLVQQKISSIGYLDSLTAEQKTPRTVFSSGAVVFDGLFPEDWSVTDQITEKMSERFKATLTDKQQGQYNLPRWIQIKEEGKSEATRVRFMARRVDGGVNLNAYVPSDLEETVKPKKMVDFEVPEELKSASFYGSYLDFFRNYPKGSKDFDSFEGPFLSHKEMVEAFGWENTDQEHLSLFTHYGYELNRPGFKREVVTDNNPDILKMIWKSDSSFVRYRQNGTEEKVQVKWGDLMLQKRFNLHKIDWFRQISKGEPKLLEAVKNDFGLVQKNSSVWTYVHGGSKNGVPKILTLKEVLESNREPDFFELLKAGIGDKSLGLVLDTKDCYQQLGMPMINCFDLYDLDTNIDAQILKIGLNIIDQYDEDSYPTLVDYPLNKAITVLSGVENIPYPFQMYQTAYRPLSDPTRAQIGMWLQCEIWNPHQPKVKNDTYDFRIAVEGKYRYSVAYTKPAGGSGSDYLPTGTAKAGPLNTFSAQLDYLQISVNNKKFIDPVYLKPADISSTGNNAQCIVDGMVGLGGLTYSYPENKITNLASDNQVTSMSFETSNSPTGGIYLTDTQIKDRARLFWLMKYPDGSWQHILDLGYYRNSFSHADNNDGAAYASVAPHYYQDLNFSQYLRLCKADPRTSRWGFMVEYADIKQNNPFSSPGTAVRTATSSASSVNDYGVFVHTNSKMGNLGVDVPAPNFYNNSGNRVNVQGTHAKWFPCMWADNVTTPFTSYYMDPDSVVRPGDAYLGSFPYAPARYQDRPMILDRPFRSVAELGYVFRDQPFKTLDLFSDKTADKYLLDLFTLSDDLLTQGEVDLDSASIEALKVLFHGNASTTPQSPSTYLKMSAAEAYEDFVSQWGRNNQLGQINSRSDLVAHLAATKTSAAKTPQKILREAALRYVADHTITNCQNWVIDLEVQHGSTDSEGNHFRQDSRYAVQSYFTVDRFTGEIVRSQREE